MKVLLASLLLFSFNSYAAPYSSYGWYARSILQIEDHAWSVQDLGYRVDRDLFIVLANRNQTDVVSEKICQDLGFARMRSNETELATCEEEYNWIAVDQDARIVRLNKKSPCPGYAYARIKSLICERP